MFLSESMLKVLKGIQESLGQLPEPVIEVVNTPSPKIIDTLDVLANSLEHSISPLIQSMEKKMDIDLRTLEKIQDLTNKIGNAKVLAAKTTRTKKKTNRKTKKRASEIEGKPSSDGKRF